MRKIDELKNPNSTLSKTDENKIIFILRGRDMSSPKIIMEWIQTNMHHLTNEKLRDAFECALAMMKTPNRKSPD